MKRFWQVATIEPSAEGYRVLLDGKPMHLPGGGVLRVEAEPLAHAIAAEWQTAGGETGGEMSFSDTPLTRLAGTAQQRIAPDPAPTVDAIARYAESDLLCYRAATPRELVERQQRHWQPWLDWVAQAYDAPLRVSTGISYVKQHRGAVAAPEYRGEQPHYVPELPWDELSGHGALTGLCKDTGGRIYCELG